MNVLVIIVCEMIERAAGYRTYVLQLWVVLGRCLCLTLREMLTPEMNWHLISYIARARRRTHRNAHCGAESEVDDGDIPQGGGITVY